MRKKTVLMLMLSLAVLAPLQACSSEPPLAEEFTSYDGLRARFTDNFLYPSYYPEGFNVPKGENTFVGSAVFMDPEQQRGDFNMDDYAYIDYGVYDEDVDTSGDWTLAVVGAQYILNEEKYFYVDESEQSDAIETTTVEIEHAGYDIECVEMFQTMLDRNGNLSGSAPHYILGLTYVFRDERGSYGFPIACSINVTDGVDAAKDSFRAFALQEVVKMYESLTPYEG